MFTHTILSISRLEKVSWAIFWAIWDIICALAYEYHFLPKMLNPLIKVLYLLNVYAPTAISMDHCWIYYSQYSKHKVFMMYIYDLDSDYTKMHERITPFVKDLWKFGVISFNKNYELVYFVEWLRFQYNYFLKK